MALKPCRECKELVSTEAKSCPHCGVSDPIGAKQRAQQRGALGCMGVIAVIVILVAVASIGDHDGRTRGSAPPATKMALIGNRVIATFGPVVACPEWKDYKQIISDLVSHDKVGEVQDFQEASCTLIQKGDAGLVIDSGFDSIRVRLDKDSQAYWTESIVGNPAQELFVSAPATSNQTDSSPKDDTVDAGHGSAAANVPVCDHCGNEECWGDQDRQDISCRDLTDTFLLSMRNATKDEVQRAMKVNGREIDSGLHFISNYSRGSLWGAGDVNFYFDAKGHVTGIDASLDSPDLKGTFDFVWDRDSLPSGCSDLSHSKLVHCDHKRSTQRLLKGIIGH